VLVLNGINSRSTSQQGGMILGLITLDTVSVTNNLYVNPSIVANNFIGSITGGTNTLTINLTSSPLFMLTTSDSITFLDPNTGSYTTRSVTAVTSANTYTFGGAALGATSITNASFSCSNPSTISFNCLKSTSLQSVVGQDIEVPRGYKQLEVQLCNNNYGQLVNGVLQSPLLIGSTGIPSVQDWGLQLNFEFYDPVPNEYNVN